MEGGYVCSMASEVMGAKEAAACVEGNAVWDLAAETCARGKSGCVQQRPVLTQVLQKPHSPSLQ